MTKQKEKDISVNPSQTSSAATHYGGVDFNWIQDIPGTINWIQMPEVNPEKITEKIAGNIKRFISKDFVKEITQSLSNYAKSLFGQAKEAFANKIGSVMSVGGRIWGALDTTPEGQGLRIFGITAGSLIGGATLLGAGPEMVTGMLRVTQMLYTLNLQETDKQIEQQIEGNITSLYATSGEALGSGLASFVSGGVFRLPRVQINMTKVTILWRALNEEARTQMLAQLRNLARSAFFGGVQIMTKIFYRDARKWLKELAKNEPEHPIIKLIPGGAKAVLQWGAGGEPWSLSLYIQKGLEKLQANPGTKNIGVFLENFIEGFGEGVQEFLPDLVRQPIS